MGSIPVSGRSPGVGNRNSNPLQYSCLENPMDRGAWRVTVHEVANLLDVTEHNTLQAFGVSKYLPMGLTEIFILKVFIHLD